MACSTARSPKKPCKRHERTGERLDCRDGFRDRTLVRDACDDAMAEAFFATLECELLDRRRFSSQAETRMAMFVPIEALYDPAGRLSALGCLPPIAYEALPRNDWSAHARHPPDRGNAISAALKAIHPVTDPKISPRWDARFLALAAHIAAWSKHRTTKVGCVVIDDDRRIRATGFNGFPRGVDDTPARLADRPTKLLLSVHAEANVVATAARAGVSLAGCTAYVTHPPCAACAALLTQAGIRRVVFQGRLREDWADSEAAARIIMAEAGVVWQYGVSTRDPEASSPDAAAAPG